MLVSKYLLLLNVSSICKCYALQTVKGFCILKLFGEVISTGSRIKNGMLVLDLKLSLNQLKTCKTTKGFLAHSLRLQREQQTNSIELSITKQPMATDLH